MKSKDSFIRAIYLCAIFVATVVLLHSFGSPVNSAPDVPELTSTFVSGQVQKVEFPDFGIAIQYPDDWTSSETSLFVSIGPQRSEPSQLYPVLTRKMHFMIYTMSPSTYAATPFGGLFADSAATSLRSITNLITSDVIEPIKSVNINGHDGAHVVFSMEYKRVSYCIALRINYHRMVITCGIGSEKEVDDLKEVTKAIVFGLDPLD